MGTVSEPQPVRTPDPYRGKQNRGILSYVNVRDLPQESPDEFCSSPLDFENSALLVWEDTLKIYDHACIENRFSENYLKYCARLEKNIKQAGSLCLTKAVLEQNGMNFPGLDAMNIRELLGMVSFHLLKCHAALDGLYKDNHLLGLTYLDWEVRWLGLSSRLRATDLKIQKIREGTVDTISLFRQEQAIREGSRSGDSGPVSGPRSLPLNTGALPISGSMAKELLRFEMAKRKEEERRRREKERLERELMSDGFLAKPFRPLSRKEIMSEIKKCREEAREEEKNEPQPAPAETGPKEEQSKTLTEAEARKVLIDRALEKGDQETVLAIQREDGEAFHRRWLRYIEEVKAENRRRAAAVRAGPDDATRRKLREKRKKKK